MPIPVDPGSRARLAASDASVARPVSGQYATPLRGSNGVSAPSQNTLFLTQLPLSRGCVLSSIGVEVTTLAASSSVRLGIYADSGGFPGALILDAGTVATTATGAAEAAISQVVSAPAVWLAVVRQSATGATLRVATSSALPVFTRSSLTVVTAFNLACFSLSGVTSALPATVTGYIGDATPPIVAVKFA